MIAFLLPLVMVFAQGRPLVFAGEQLTYVVSSARFGKIGSARLNTQLFADTFRLTFETKAKFLIFGATDKTISDLDAENLRTLRYSKHERSPIGKRDENVQINHATGFWADARGKHRLATDDALDELSFIYLIRSLELQPGQEIVINRHFDVERNPIRLRMIAADSFLNGRPVHVIEMKVRDRRQDAGVSMLRFFISSDELRLPVRIESNMPVAGRITMTLVP